LLFVLVLGDESEHIRHLLTTKLQYICLPICMTFAHQVYRSLVSWLSPERLIRVFRIAPFPALPFTSLFPLPLYFDIRAYVPTATDLPWPRCARQRPLCTRRLAAPWQKFRRKEAGHPKSPFSSKKWDPV